MNNEKIILSIEAQVANLATVLTEMQLSFACAESCTGGLLSKCCTDIAGSSEWFERAYITYSNEAKQQMLGVGAQLIQEHGAVSEPVARAMVSGVIENAPVQVAASVTGIAGPGGGSQAKPVGTVCFGFFTPVDGFQVETCHFDGDREKVRLQSVAYVLAHLLQHIRAE
ncbi:MAG: CinA family protein [Gammaproteobacteria bacterium]